MTGVGEQPAQIFTPVWRPWKGQDDWVQMDRHANGQAGGNGGGGGTLKESESEELARRFSHRERIPASPSRCAPVPTPGGTAGRIENCQIGRRRSDGPPQPDPREPFWAESTAVARFTANSRV
ncbi:hypothetical protein ACQP1V_28240 [Microtetraspora malaysiensis]|uniref:hypothetical protein n=1 Tax=Microtetraspora malaysiensis TaxID=161358 RepID=UPI003D8AC587